jgi:glucokinase
MIILAGDIGATKTHLALYRSGGLGLTRLRDHIYTSQELPSLEAAISDFIEEPEQVAGACFGIPGPIVGGITHTTNIAWVVREASLSGQLPGASVRLVNDLVATAYGML